MVDGKLLWMREGEKPDSTKTNTTTPMKNIRPMHERIMKLTLEIGKLIIECQRVVFLFLGARKEHIFYAAATGYEKAFAPSKCLDALETAINKARDHAREAYWVKHPHWRQPIGITAITLHNMLTNIADLMILIRRNLTNESDIENTEKNLLQVISNLETCMVMFDPMVEKLLPKKVLQNEIRRR
jgi:hypothetical protein